jgi:hypothetical protein
MISQSQLFEKLKGQRKVLKRVVFQYKTDKIISNNDISSLERIITELDSIMYELSVTTKEVIG